MDISVNTWGATTSLPSELIGQLRRVSGVAATAALLRSYEAKIAPDKSYRVRLLDGELRWDDASVAPPRTWDREPEASAWRRWTARAVGWLPIESQL